jgi:hypothetical protein
MPWLSATRDAPRKTTVATVESRAEQRITVEKSRKSETTSVAHGEETATSRLGNTFAPSMMVFNSGLSQCERSTSIGLSSLAEPFLRAVFVRWEHVGGTRCELPNRPSP